MIYIISFLVGSGLILAIVTIPSITEENMNKYQKPFPSKIDKERYKCFKKYKAFNIIASYEDTTCPGKLDIDSVNIDPICKDCDHYNGKYNYLTPDNEWVKGQSVGFKVDN